MNLLIKRPALFLVSLISLFSCTDSNDLNTAFEGSLIDAVYTDTISITASTVLAKDSIIGYQRGNLLAGTFSNDIFGTTTANAYVAIGPSGGSFVANSRPDSVVLVLDYDEYYGDTTENYTVEVHELTKAFAIDKTYYTNNNNELTYSPDVLGAATFIPAPKRKTIIKDAKTGEEKKFSIPVRIKLNNELGQRIMALPAATLSNTTEFSKTFKGIVLSPGANTNSALGFTPGADSTYLRIYYTSEGKKQKYDLPIIGNYDVPIPGSNDRLNQISSDLSGSKLASLKKSGDSIASAAAGDEAYLQESTGIVTKLTFPYLNHFREKLNIKDLAVNRAELLIPVKEQPIPVKEDNFYLPSPFAYLVETNKTNRILKTNGVPRILREDPLVSATSKEPQAAALRYDKTKKAYVVNITKYVQDLIYNRQSAFGALTSKSLLLVPTSRSGVLDATGATVLEATGLYQSVLQTAGSDKIKLQLYFSKAN